MSQVSLGRVSDVLFHKTIYSQHSNTETARDGSSEEGCTTKKPLISACAFIPSMFACAQALLLLSSLLLPPLCVHPPCFCHPSPSLSKRSAIPSSCCVSVSIYLSGTTHLPALCYAKVWQFTASCLGLPPRAQSALPSASLTAPCKPSYLEQRYSSTRRQLYQPSSSPLLPSTQGGLVKVGKMVSLVSL